MAIAPLIGPRRRVRVVLSSTALLSFMSVRKAAALALAQLGVAAFFIAGVSSATLGPSAGWFVLVAAVLAAFVRAIDIESWAVFIPGGFVGRVEYAFGPPLAAGAAATVLTERFVLAALAAVIVGHYASGVAVTAIAGLRLTGLLRPEDFATMVAVVIVGLLWIRARVGLDLRSDTIARAVWISVGVLVLTALWSAATAVRIAAPVGPIVRLPDPDPSVRWYLDETLKWLLGLCLVVPTIGGGEALAQAAHELEPPRVQALRRTALVTLLFALFVTTLTTFLFALLVPAPEQSAWVSAPLAGLAQHLAAPRWLRDVVAIAVVLAALLILAPAAHAALGDAEHVLEGLSAKGTLPEALAALHTRFGTPARAIDVTAAATILIVLAGSGRVEWLGRAYAIAVAATVVLKAATLLRLRRKRTEAKPFKVALNLEFGHREVALGVIGCGALVGASALAMIASGDGPSIATLGLLAGLTVLFTFGRHELETRVVSESPATLDLLPAAELSLNQIDARVGNVLVPVRNPHSLMHLSAALQAARDRDVVVMTVRLVGVDVAEDAATDAAPTTAEQRLLSEVIAVAERQGRPVRLLIVPAHNVFDAIVSTILRLRSSDIHVGESSTLSADEQARLLGDAWERAEKTEALDVRLVVYHRSGRTDSYHLGAHPPSLTAADLDQIHRLWLDVSKAIGPHVHHHDVVRAALRQMEQQLNGTQREEALGVVRQIARLADELAAVLRARDYARLRDMIRNRHAGELAALLTELSTEDQVVVFRVMPRKDAATVFEYLEHDAKETLLKAMAQEDVAALLNDMAPDDRTMFLEELPATATRQLLGLLTPKERSVAVTLLGYPERSIGRLMTPHYVAVREHWTVREVLDYVRAHGQDSETLNVIYVVDEQGLLIDDIRIREFLLAPVDRKVADLMDRHFVALKATDDQTAAVAVFREYDRSALPVTDTTGMLIGIVTIDDVLDVAEATATREIQRIGGSEALDEPYMDIGFAKMIQKRAGWLTALFLGEMLTATAMASFEQEITKAVVLALFVPLIISSGGNSGSQAATLVIRALALGEVGLRDWWRVMRREILAGLALGMILGAIGFLRITLWSAFADTYGQHWLLIAWTVALSLVGVVLWGTLTGSLLPLLMRRLGFDPAASSAPFVATLVDVTGLVIYFTVALVVLHGTLL
jgi:magnesium transporter